MRTTYDIASNPIPAADVLSSFYGISREEIVTYCEELKAARPDGSYRQATPYGSPELTALQKAALELLAAQFSVASPKRLAQALENAAGIAFSGHT